MYGILYRGGGILSFSNYNHKVFKEIFLEFIDDEHVTQGKRGGKKMHTINIEI